MRDNLIINEFGSLMEKLHEKGAEPRIYYSESLLPHPKIEIQSAIISELLKLIPDTNLKEAQPLIDGLIFLERFLPDKLAAVGNVDLINLLEKFRKEDPDAYKKLIS